MSDYLKRLIKQEETINSLNGEEKEYLGIVRLVISLNNYFKYYGQKNMLKTLTCNLLNENDRSHWEDSNSNREKYILSFLFRFDYPYGGSFNAPVDSINRDNNAFCVFKSIKKYKEEEKTTWKDSLLSYVEKNPECFC